MAPGQALSQRETSKRSGLDEGFTSRIVRWMEERGLVTRTDAGTVKFAVPETALAAPNPLRKLSKVPAGIGLNLSDPQRYYLKTTQPLNHSTTQPMNKNLTQIVFILDRSGSMQSMATEAIGGFNAFVEAQQKEEGEANISLILFDHEYLPVTMDTPIKEMPELTEADYVPRGTTALLDAMGRTIDDLGKRLSSLPEDARPADVIVVTLTDGLENASSDYARDQVAKMVKHQQEKYGWEFLFLGADLESVRQAEALNIPTTNARQYASVEEGIYTSSLTISERRREQRRKSEKKIGF